MVNLIFEANPVFARVNGTLTRGGILHLVKEVAMNMQNQMPAVVPDRDNQGQLIPLLKSARARAEREAISLALKACGGNVTHAAESLGVSRAQLYRLISKLQLSPALLSGPFELFAPNRRSDIPRRSN